MPSLPIVSGSETVRALQMRFSVVAVEFGWKGREGRSTLEWRLGAGYTRQAVGILAF